MSTEVAVAEGMEWFSEIQTIVNDLAVNAVPSESTRKLLDEYYENLCKDHPLSALIGVIKTPEINAVDKAISQWALENKPIRPIDVQKEWIKRKEKKAALQKALKERKPHENPEIDAKMIKSLQTMINQGDDAIEDYEAEYHDLIPKFLQREYLEQITVTTYEGEIVSIEELRELKNKSTSQNGRNQAERAKDFRQHVLSHIKTVYPKATITEEPIDIDENPTSTRSAHDVGFDISGVMLVVCASGKVPVEKFNRIKAHEETHGKRIVVLARTSKAVYGQEIIHPFHEALFHWRCDNQWDFEGLSHVCKWLSTKDFSIPDFCNAAITWIF